MVHYEASPLKQSDMEEGHDYEVSSGEEQQRFVFRRKHAVAAVLGAAALFGCGAAVGLKGSQEQPKKLTARMLFESDVIHHAAAENVLRVHSGVSEASKSKEEVKKIVSETFRNIIGQMKTVDPEMWHRLERVEMTQEQHDGVAHIMGKMKDPRVMKLGMDTAAALREAGSDSKNAEAKSVYNKFMPRQAEIRALYDEVMPKHMQELFKYQPGDGFKRMLDPSVSSRLKSVGGTYYDQFTAPEKSITNRRLQFHPAAAAAPAYAAPAVSPATGVPAMPAAPSYQYSGESQGMKKALEALGIIGTVTAEADTMVRIINPICKEFNHDLAINPAITTGIGAADFLFQIADCECDAVADHMNPVEAMGCPAMAGSAGFDAMREVFTATGVLGDNNAANGHQGNHEGEGKVHEGVFDDTDEGKAVEHSFPMCVIMNKCGK